MEAPSLDDGHSQAIDFAPSTQDPHAFDRDNQMRPSVSAVPDSVAASDQRVKPCMQDDEPKQSVLPGVQMSSIVTCLQLQSVVGSPYTVTTKAGMQQVELSRIISSRRSTSTAGKQRDGLLI